MQIAPGIHRIGDRSITNAYLVEEANQVTLVDAGVPDLYRDLPRELASMGRTIADVRALVLTHGHSDHIGFAERLRNDRHVPILIHEADAALARGEVPNPSKGYGPIRLAPLVGFLWYSLLRGGIRTHHLGGLLGLHECQSEDKERQPDEHGEGSPSHPGIRRGAPCSTSGRSARSGSAMRSRPTR